MSFSRFFIDRPIFAAVLSLLIVVGGALALLRLPISEYPSVVPPTVVVRATYPGANPKIIAETVASPLEQQINGVEGLLYMASQSTADGLMTLTITFALDTDLDIAQVQIQNRVSQALPRLPSEVQRIGVTTEKASPDLMMVVHLFSPDERYDMLYLSNFVHLQVKDELARIGGVGSAQVFGAGEYSMRVWLDPDRLAALQLTATDVVRAIREQNVQVAAGVLGAPPAPSDTTFQLSINAQGRLISEEQFAEIVVRATPEGQITRVRDVGRVELGANRYALRSLLDNKPAVAIGISQRPGSNALEASSQVRAVMARLKESFPEGVDYRIVYDPTHYVRQSIRAVVVTLFEAIVLVVIVVIVFLQTWRASIIPLVAVPVSLVGTFAVMLMLGFSLNTLSLFGLVLAIGIVVDDAIVVVENVERHIELGASPIEATRKAMDEVSGPIIAIALVLCAVFVPTAFISGLTGPVLPAVRADDRDLDGDLGLQLADAQPGAGLAAAAAARRPARRRAAGVGPGVRLVLPGLQPLLQPGLGGLLGRRVARAACRRGGAGGLCRSDWPDGRGFCARAAGLRAGAGQGLPRRVRAAARRLDARSHRGRDPADVGHRARTPRRGERDRVSRAVDQRLRERSNAGIVFVTLKPTERAARRGAHRRRHRAGAQRQLWRHPGSLRRDLPAARRAGSWLRRWVQALRRGPGRSRVRSAVQPGAGGARRRAEATPALAGLFSSFQVSVPQIDTHVDRERAKTYGVALTDVFETLQVYLGSLYANDFNRFGRTYQVNVQAESAFRLQPEQIQRLKTRNAQGAMVPLGSLVSVERGYGPDQVMHYNGFPAAEINGGPAPGVSSGQAQEAIAGVLGQDAAARDGV